LPNVGPYIYDVNISGFTRSSIYIHDISSLRVNTSQSCYGLKELALGAVLNIYFLLLCVE